MQLKKKEKTGKLEREMTTFRQDWKPKSHAFCLRVNWHEVLRVAAAATV